ncbi:hypothetical protein SAMN05216456_2433 [Devosia crocina]|uniref:Protoheme IX farnesyltransferase n=1 Tax=Devosia crocina TaxID=429728 RepID=A0A1I7NP49_9HYPH|nr:hypothetical protein [Devosia crocina]SFV36330.1 hypothetical protein SAMN05216456_2433 [Devosia crocina]
MTENQSAVMVTPAETAAAEALKRVRRRRSLALAGALALFALTFYVLTIVKLGPALFDRGL